MYQIKIGKVLKRLIEQNHKTLKAVSHETKIPYSTLHTWLENRKPRDILKVKQLAEYFGITLHQLLFDRSEYQDEKLTVQMPIQQEILNGVFEMTIKRIE
ncbi:MAG: helix-turn-helix domain-containing protein [Pseudobdellovibrionaceae bacterium]